MSGRPSRNPRKPLYNNNNRTGNGGRKNNRSDPRANNIRRKQKSNAMDEEEKSDDVYYVTFSFCNLSCILLNFNVAGLAAARIASTVSSCDMRVTFISPTDIK